MSQSLLSRIGLPLSKLSTTDSNLVCCMGGKGGGERKEGKREGRRKGEGKGRRERIHGALSDERECRLYKHVIHKHVS